VDPSLLADRGVVLDVRCVLADRRRIHVEIQLTSNAALPARVLYYWSRNYGADLRRGDQFSELTPAVTIVWLFEPLFALQRQFRSVFTLRERVLGHVFCDHLCIITLEVPHLRHSRATALQTLWSRWLSAESAADLEQLAGEHATMAEAKRAHEKIVSDPVLQAQLRERERLLERAGVDRATDLAFARREGRRQGLLEGERKGLLEGERKGLLEGERRGQRQALARLARVYLAEGMPAAEIAALLRLTELELGALLTP
jgi:predicted transposase/invertase (TIGR01784 family)